MSTPLTDSINALTTYANEVTGASDTTLSDAVHSLASGYGGGSALWKTVTLEEDHTRDAVGLVSYWGTFLGVPDDADNTYFADFTNNSAIGVTKCDFIWWKGTTTISARGNYGNISGATARSCYATIGTVINIYKLPKQ